MSGHEAESDGRPDATGAEPNPGPDFIAHPTSSDDPTELLAPADEVPEQTEHGASSAGLTGADDTGAPDPTDSAAPAAPGAASAMASRRGDRPDLAGRQRRRDEEGDDDNPRRRRWLIGVVTAVVIIAVAVGLTIYLIVGRTAAVSGPGPAGTSPSPTAAAVLTPATMLSAAQAALILPNTRWTVVSDQSGETTSTSAACLSPNATQGGPTPQLIRSRTLSAAGTNAPMVLHKAEEFGSTDEATVTYALFLRALGSCDLANSYLLNGSEITGLGDQSTGVVVEDQAKKQYRTVVIDRTGTVVNVLDVVTDQSLGDGPLEGAVKALGKVTDSQCTAAIGECASLVTVADGPPPVAGDQPGYLAVADIPQPESGTGNWAGLTPAKPGTLVTTGCENVDFSKVDAVASGARSYLLSDKPAGMPDSFGLDEAVFTMSDAKSATDLAKQLTDNIQGCKARQLTATVSQPKTVAGVGADGIAIDGKTYLVTQQTSETATSDYKVGVATAGAKVIYTFLPTEGKFDLTDDQWTALTERAAQRATQTS